MDRHPQLLELQLRPCRKKWLLALVQQRATLDLAIGQPAFGRSLTPNPVAAMTVGPDFLSGDLGRICQMEQPKSQIMVEGTKPNGAARLPKQRSHLLIMTI